MFAFVALSAIVAINLGLTGKMYGVRADFTLLFLQNEDVLHTKQHMQERYVNDLSIDAIIKTKNAKSIIIILKMSKKCVDKQIHTHTHTG